MELYHEIELKSRKSGEKFVAPTLRRKFEEPAGS